MGRGDSFVTTLRVHADDFLDGASRVVKCGMNTGMSMILDEEDMAERLRRSA